MIVLVTCGKLRMMKSLGFYSLLNQRIIQFHVDYLFIQCGFNINFSFCCRFLFVFMDCEFFFFVCLFEAGSGMANRVKEDEKNERIIRGLLKLPENRRCINCNSLVSAFYVFLSVLPYMLVSVCLIKFGALRTSIVKLNRPWSQLHSY